MEPGPRLFYAHLRCTSPIRDCGESPEEGYTAGYTPALGTDLSAQYDADLISGDDTFFVGSNFSLNCSLYLGEMCSKKACTETQSFEDCRAWKAESAPTLTVFPSLVRANNSLSPVHDGIVRLPHFTPCAE